MRTPPPAKPHSENMQRAEEKRQKILNFLARGEVYSTAQMIADHMSCSKSSAERTLAAMVSRKELNSEDHLVKGYRCKIFGITAHGLAIADALDFKPFKLGKTSSLAINHHLQTQQARIAAERAGWTEWKPGKILYGLGLKKVPDAIAKAPSGVVVAIEIENQVKTIARIENIIAEHLQCVSQNKWREVHYLSPKNISIALPKAFSKIQTIPIKSERVQLQQVHRNIFKFFDADNWPPQ